MEIAELVLKYLRALVWPGVVITLAVVFRHQLADAFKRVTRLETVAGSLEFAEQALEAREDAQDLVDGDLPTPAGTPAEAAQAENDGDEVSAGADEANGEIAEDGPDFGAEVGLSGLRRSYPYLPTAHDYLPAALLITTSPVAAVGAAANTLELTLKSVLERHPNADASHLRGHQATLGRLTAEADRLGVPQRTFRVLRTLTELRNSAMHHRIEVTQSAARDFIESCSLISQELQRWAGQFPLRADWGPPRREPHP